MSISGYARLSKRPLHCRLSRHFSPCPNAPERLLLLAVALLAVSPPLPSHVAGGALTFSKGGPVGAIMAKYRDQKNPTLLLLQTCETRPQNTLRASDR